MTHHPDLCQFLEWDSNFFQLRIGRVTQNHLKIEDIKTILDWCKDHRIDCLYFLAASDHPDTIRLAEQNDFQMVEIRLIMERSLKDWQPGNRVIKDTSITIRHPEPQDLAILEEIAAFSYVDSRYYFDQGFDPQKWQAYYATWVKKSCQGEADLALVAEKDGIVVGYITGNINKENPEEGIYELTGVAPEARRSGVGQELFRSGLDWFVEHGVVSVWLATQGRNIPTQRMIQRNGFITRACQIYYHKWFSQTQAG
ncbi:MAG TPA: GNAT family N-acetyltransferase [Anaerolineales bacterium]|nr:GNAT family N-acetyltransferase [Anaerolineales bacterium]